MITIEQIDAGNRRQRQRFIDLPFRLYGDCPQWVSPLRSDVALALNHRKHPFYEHSVSRSISRIS